MSDTPFIVIAIVIIVATLFTLLTTPLASRIFDLEAGKPRVIGMAILFLFGLFLAYGGWWVLSSTGAATIAFHKKQAMQMEEPTLLR